jgi:hypothetical protein
MNEVPKWYTHLKEEPFEQKTFTVDMADRIEQKLRKKREGSRIATFLGPAVALIILVGAGIYTFTYLPWEKVGKPSTLNPANVGDLSPTPIPSPLHTPVSTTPPMDESSLYPYPLNLMLNSVDYFTDIKGSYRYWNKNLGVDQTVSFEVVEGAKPGSYSRIVNNIDGQEENVQTSDDGINLLMLQIRNKNYIFAKYGGPAIIPSGPRYYKDQNGDNVWNGRQDPSHSLANEMISPSNYAFWTIDPNVLKPNFSIIGHETILSRDAIMMEGQLDSYMSGKHGAEKYNYWVDSKTGVMIKMQLKNAEGQIVEASEMLNVEFNKGVDRTKFSVEPPQGWTDATPRHDHSNVNTGFTAGDFPVPDAIKVKWEVAKKNRKETTVIQYDKNWYIIPEEGYLVNQIIVNGNTGTIVLSPTSKGLVPAVAQNYTVDEMKIEYQ